jgi:predicted metal-dependent peptidase
MFNTRTELTPEQRLQKAAIAILAHPAYTAMNGVFMIGAKRIEPDPRKCPTAYTNGKDEVYGAEFVAQCSDANVRFLMIHECEHKMRRDLWVNRHLQEIDPRLANMAMDYVINLGIVERHRTDGFAKMDGPLSIGCYSDKYKGWTTVQVFNDLRENGPPNGGGSGNGPPNGGGSGNGQGSLDEHGWGDAQEMTEEEAKALEKEIMEAVRQGAIAAGKLGHDLDRTIKDMLHPPVDWREALREFITDTCAGNDYSTYRKPHRRYLAQNIYMPSGASDKVGRILCAGDMSGSIGNREQAMILGCIADMADTVKPEGLDMIYWHTAVSRHEAYEPEDVGKFATSTKPTGTGGTDVRCVPAYMDERGLKPQCAIVITDGYLYGGWGEWPCPVLWVIFDNPNAAPTTGAVVHIDSKHL